MKQTYLPFDPLPQFTRDAVAAAAQAFVPGQPEIYALGWRWKVKPGVPPQGFLTFLLYDPHAKYTLPHIANIPRKIKLSEIMRNPANPYDLDLVETRFVPIRRICPLAAPPSSGNQTLEGFIQSGQTIRHQPSGKEGTICAIVRKPNDNARYLISAGHVLDDGRPPGLDALLQNGQSSNTLVKVAQLASSNRPFDIALAQITHANLPALRTIKGILTPPGAPTDVLNVGDRVVKSGKTTQVTRGIVSLINIYQIPQGQPDAGFDSYSFAINPNVNGGTQTPVKPFALRGDSGAMVAAERNGQVLPVGLLVSLLEQGDGSVRYLARNLNDVLRKFNVSMI